jgi:hypothetical protein
VNNNKNFPSFRKTINTVPQTAQWNARDISEQRHTASISDRACLKCDGTRTENRFGLSAKRTSPFKSVGASVQSTAGNRVVRISGSNAGYTMFCGRVQDYLLTTPFVCFPFTSPTVPHRVPSGFNWAIHEFISSSYSHKAVNTFSEKRHVYQCNEFIIITSLTGVFLNETKW